MPEEILFEDERERSRADVAGYLRRIADKLDRGGAISLTAGEQSVSIDPPDGSTFEVKVERETAPGAETGELSLELELEWREGDTVDGEELTVE